MFPKKKTYVDNEISRLVLELKDNQVESDEYGAILDHLGKLQKIRQEEKPDPIHTDTIATIAANLIGILMILQHENLNIITSKALSLVRFR